MLISRRHLIKMLPATAVTLATSRPALANPVVQPTTSYGDRVYMGADFSDWEVTLGDALYAREGEDPVSVEDIDTIHHNTYSELRANILQRIIMAHNITFKRFVDDAAFQYIHTCGYKFRLPYLPEPDITTTENAESVEGGIFAWDGRNTRLDYGIAFQWGLNPWDEFGTIRTWTSQDPAGEWTNVGYLEPDTAWHEVKMVVDHSHQTAALLIDGIHMPTHYTAVTKPAGWGAETAVRLQAEIVSIYPEPSGMQAMHRAEFKDWYWLWEPAIACQAYLPVITTK